MYTVKAKLCFTSGSCYSIIMQWNVIKIIIKVYIELEERGLLI